MQRTYSEYGLAYLAFMSYHFL